jgi:NhaP-type Na+/H+ or K+/H+ antiporter
LLLLTSRWGLCILCVLLIGALCTSYYLQLKRIRAIHETVISIFAGMVVGLIIRMAPGHLIRDMLVSSFSSAGERAVCGCQRALYAWRRGVTHRAAAG